MVKHEPMATASTERAASWPGLRARLRDQFTLFKFVVSGANGYIIFQIVFVLGYVWTLLGFLPDKGQELRLLGFSHSDARLLITTLVAAELSIAGVFAGHHFWTFRDRVTMHRPIWLRFAQFNAKAAVSSLGILTLIVNLLTLGLGVTPYLAIPVGVATASIWNWLWDSSFIWRPVDGRNNST